MVGDTAQTRPWVSQVLILCPELTAGKATSRVVGCRNGITNYFNSGTERFHRTPDLSVKSLAG